MLSEWVLTLYKGVHVLIRRGLTEPAQLLARTLLEDAVRLLYFRLYPKRLEEFAVRWLLEALVEEQALETAAAFQFPEAGKFVTSPAEEMAALKTEAQAKGWTSKLPEMKDMATAVDHLHLYWLFKYYSTKVHTSRLALGSIMEEQPDGSTKLGVTGSAQEAIRVGQASAEGLILSFFSVADLLGWQDQLTALAQLQQFNVGFFDKLMDAAGMGPPPPPPGEGEPEGE